jgi:hypothetical protein
MKKIMCLILLALVPVTSVLAVKMPGLYQAELTVSSQTEELKEQAIQDGLLQVLIKVSGNTQIEDNPVIKSSLKKAAYYVQEYDYLPPTTSSSQYTLQIRYEPDDILRLLKKAGIAYWRENRPLILVWLAVTDEQQQIDIIGDDTTGPFLNRIKDQAKKYGLPLIFPVMDVADLNQVSVADITNMRLPVLKEAAKRYAPDAILIGSIVTGHTDIQSHWQFLLGDQEWKWTLSQNTSEEMIVAVINQVNEVLAKHYEIKVSDNAPAWLKLEITHINQRDDLKQLIHYLKQLTSVLQVHLMQITGDTVEISVLVRGPRDVFEQSAVVGQHLVLQSQEAKTNEILMYEWVN